MLLPALDRKLLYVRTIQARIFCIEKSFDFGFFNSWKNPLKYHVNVLELIFFALVVYSCIHVCDSPLRINCLVAI